MACLQHVVKVVTVRICGPSTTAIEPMSDYPEELREKLVLRHYFVDGGINFTGKAENVPLDKQEIARVGDELVQMCKTRQLAARPEHQPLWDFLALEPHAGAQSRRDPEAEAGGGGDSAVHQVLVQSKRCCVRRSRVFLSSRRTACRFRVFSVASYTSSPRSLTGL